MLKDITRVELIAKLAKININIIGIEKAMIGETLTTTILFEFTVHGNRWKKGFATFDNEPSNTDIYNDVLNTASGVREVLEGGE